MVPPYASLVSSSVARPEGGHAKADDVTSTATAPRPLDARLFRVSLGPPTGRDEPEAWTEDLLDCVKTAQLRSRWRIGVSAIG